MTTGELIKSARKSAHITQKKLGEKLGVAYQTVAQWENDLRNPKLDTLQRIAAALDIPVTELIDDWNAIDTEGVAENAGRRVKTMAEQEKGGQGMNTRKPIVLRTRPEESGVGVVRLSRKAQMAVRRLQERSNLPARQIVSEIVIQAEDLVDVDPPDD